MSSTHTPATRTSLVLNSSNNLTGKVVVVVGAKNKVGIAICRTVHAAGARVVMADSRLESLKKICETLNNGNGEDSPASRIHAPPKTASVVMVDVTDSTSMKRLAGKAQEAFGTIDIVVNVCGYQQRSLISACQEKDWSHTMDINCKGLLHVFGAFLPGMVANNAGQIISVSSEAARAFFPRLTVYGASKQFVETLSKGANSELSEHGVRVTTVQAGDCTEELNGVEEKRDNTGEEYTKLNPADVANAVLFAAAAKEEKR